jgi:hypothetical protein
MVIVLVTEAAPLTFNGEEMTDPAFRVIELAGPIWMFAPL